MKRLKLGLVRRRVGSAKGAAVETATLWSSAEGYMFAGALAPALGQEAENEGLSLLSNSIIEQHIAYGRRGVVVCGASGGVGVTFVAANLAIAVARTGIPTLLVDANFRRPSIQDLIRPPTPPPGFCELLEREDPIVLSRITQEVMPQLSVIYAGHCATQPSELLASARFRDVVFACLRDFPFVVFDAPPANRSPDARAIGAAVGYALLVARRGGSYADDLALLARQLEQDRVEIVGGVLNEA